MRHEPNAVHDAFCITASPKLRYLDREAGVSTGGAHRFCNALLTGEVNFSLAQVVYIMYILYIRKDKY